MPEPAPAPQVAEMVFRRHLAKQPRWVMLDLQRQAVRPTRSAPHPPQREPARRHAAVRLSAWVAREAARPHGAGGAALRPPRGRPGAAHPGGRRLLLLVLARLVELAALLDGGMSNKLIARAMSVSDETVKWHLKNLFSKLSAGTRKHAVDRARLLGLLVS